MKIELLSSTKNQDINISENAFSKDFNEALVHQAVVSFLAGSRQGSSKQKTRSEVRGGGKNHTDKKELVEPVQVLSEVLFGEVAV